MLKKTKICRLCSDSYVEDSKCCEGYCQVCSKFHTNYQKRNIKIINKKEVNENGRNSRKTTINNR